MAAIAMPGQVEALSAAMARRSPLATRSDDRTLVMLVEADGVRNLLTVGTWRGPFPMPRRLTVAMHQTLDADGHADGSATLDGVPVRDARRGGTRARDVRDARTRWHVMIETQLGARGGIGRLLAGAVAGMAGIDVDALESSVDALEFQTAHERVVLHGSFTAHRCGRYSMRRASAPIARSECAGAARRNHMRRRRHRQGWCRSPPGPSTSPPRRRCGRWRSSAGTEPSRSRNTGRRSVADPAGHEPPPGGVPPAQPR